MNKKAFTLIELLVVIAIVGVLSGFIFVSMTSAINSAKDAKRKADLSSIEKALLVYGANHGGAYPYSALDTYPCNLTGSTNLCTNTNLAGALSPYLGVLPTDPNGTSYTYTGVSDTSSFILRGTLSNGNGYYYSSPNLTWTETTSPFVGWGYKKTVTLSSTLTQDYQIKLTIPFGSGGCESHCNADFSDLRFATTGGTALSYWIESFTASTTATVWVKALNGSTAFNMYYGKTGTTTTANGETTFLFFDHFTSPAATYDTAKWNVGGGTISVSNSIMSDTGQVDTGIYEKNSLSTLGTASRMYSNFGSPSTWSRMGIAYGNYYGGSFLQSGTYGGGWVAETCLVQPDRVWTNISIGSGYHVYEITRTDASHTSFYSDGALLATNTQKIGTTSVAAFSFTANGGPINTDWVLLRKYVSPEPTGSLGAESSN
jgi:prepilin-type N-terminal cleavage/methylation domain-containing protein